MLNLSKEELAQGLKLLMLSSRAAAIVSIEGGTLDGVSEASNFQVQTSKIPTSKLPAFEFGSSFLLNIILSVIILYLLMNFEFIKQ